MVSLYGGLRVAGKTWKTPNPDPERPSQWQVLLFKDPPPPLSQITNEQKMNRLTGSGPETACSSVRAIVIVLRTGFRRVFHGVTS